MPLTALALFAWTYSWVRAGARAAIALAVGVFGVVAGVEAVYYTAKSGPSGDDFTGLASIPAGLLLVGVGAVTLWRTRRNDDRLRRRYVRRFLVVVGALVVAYVFLSPLYISYVFTHVARVSFLRPSWVQRTKRSRSRRATGCSSEAGTSRRRTVRR